MQIKNLILYFEEKNLNILDEIKDNVSYSR